MTESPSALSAAAPATSSTSTTHQNSAPPERRRSGDFGRAPERGTCRFVRELKLANEVLRVEVEALALVKAVGVKSVHGRVEANRVDPDGDRHALEILDQLSTVPH